jgi:hypothetical protein
LIYYLHKFRVQGATTKLGRRDTAFYFVDHAANRIAQFFDHMLISRQGMTLCMVENKSCIWVANIVERDVTVKVWVKGANYSIVREIQ